MKRRSFGFLWLLLLLFVLTTCAPAYRGEPVAGPLDTADPQIALGERVFYEHCHQCHPGGATGLGSGLNNLPLPGWLISFQVRHGIGVMPAFSEEQIGNEELDALVMYLLRLREHGVD